MDVPSTTKPAPPPRADDTHISVSTGGVGLFGLLFVVLVALKVSGQADLSWPALFAVLFGPVTIFLGIIGALVACAAVVVMLGIPVVGLMVLMDWVLGLGRSHKAPEPTCIQMARGAEANAGRADSSASQT